MNKVTHRAWAEVNLDAIAQNIQGIRRITNPNAKVMAVVKADAYGHGYLEVSRTLLENGADFLGVACIDEAEQLRKRGVNAPILILGYTPLKDLERAVISSVTPTIYDMKSAMTLSKFAIKNNIKANLHIKIDTGMSRIGYMPDRESSLIEVEQISKLPMIEIEGIFSHLARADEVDNSYSLMQFDKFMAFCTELENRGIYIPIKHICNSAGIMQYPQMHLDMVRPGIIIYGQYPSDEVDKQRLKLIPAMELKAFVTRVDEIDAGTKVSYGGIYEAKNKMKLATVPIGYADGYLRLLSGKARMVVGGNYCPVVGRICMDQCMIDISGVNNISVEDEVTVFGKYGDKEVSVDELAANMGTINYEVLCVIGKRVPRIYMRNNEIVNVLNYLDIM